MAYTPLLPPLNFNNQPSYQPPPAGKATNPQALKAQLSAGAINRQQFLQQFAAMPGNSTKAGIAQKYSPRNVGGATGGAVKDTLITGLQAVPRALTELALSAQPTNNAVARPPSRVGPTMNIKQMPAPVPVQRTAPTPSLVTPTNPVTKALLGPTPVTSIQAQSKGATEAHPGGFHVKGTPITLSPGQTGLAEAIGKTGVDVGTVALAGRGLVKTVDRVHAKVTGNGHEAKFANHVQSFLAQQAEQQAATDVARAAGISHLRTAEDIARTPPPTRAIAAPAERKLLNAPATTDTKLLGPGGPNFILSSAENARVMNGTHQLVKQYEKDYGRITAAYKDSPKRLQSEVNKLDDHYIGRHSDLLNGVGEFATQTPKTLSSAITKAKTTTAAPAATARTTPATATTTAPQAVAGEAKAVVPNTRGSIVKPVENPTNVSKVSKSVQERSLEKKLTDTGFEQMAGYTAKTVEDQSARVANLITTDTERAKAIIRGEKPVPKGMSGSMLIKGVEEHALANNDVELMKDLAKSPLVSQTSTHAQELRLLRERQPNSPVAHIQDILDARIKAAEKRMKQPFEKVLTTTANDIKKEVKPPSKYDWQTFVNSIKC